MVDSSEIQLSGGNINAEVVRVGDTVRRRPCPHSQSVHRLLQHLEAQGYDLSPRFLGLDDQGREILSFIPGSTNFPINIWRNPDFLRRSVEALQGYHEATLSFQHDATDRWAFAYPGDPEVICHNDFAPYNMVFSNGLPVSVIDFDLAGPGPRLRDLAYLAYWIAPLSFGAGDMVAASEQEMRDGNPRLLMICDIYGTTDYVGLLDMIGEVLIHMSSHTAARDMVGDAAAQKLADGGHFDHWKTEAEAFVIHRSRLLENLLTGR